MNLMIQLCKGSKMYKVETSWEQQQKKKKTPNKIKKKIKPTTQTSEEYYKEIGSVWS